MRGPSDDPAMTTSVKPARPNRLHRSDLCLPCPPAHWPIEIFRVICQSAALFIIVLGLLLVGVLVWQAWESIEKTGLSFFTTSTWDPVDDVGHRRFGSLAFVYGTVATSMIAMMLAVPMAVGTATFLAEIAPRGLRRAGSFFVEMLAAIPSVVYGFWGIYVMAPALQSLITATAAGGPRSSRRGHPAGGTDPGDHDRPLRSGSLFRCDSVGAALAASEPPCRARGATRRRGHLVGHSPLLAASTATSADVFLLSPAGSGLGRDHGGDHAHRQPRHKS